jgi:predicted outer membrane repeat protein
MTRHPWQLAPLVWLALAACTPNAVFFDTDGDGAADHEDCAPEDPQVYPGAQDQVGDDLDSNCDGIDGVLDCDADDDGHLSLTCGGDDCDDLNPDASPSELEACDGLDNDCDGQTPRDEVDADDDGLAPCEGDCDDLAPFVHPGAAELCDGLDNDCDGALPPEEEDGDLDGQSGCDGDCDDEDGSVDGLDVDGDGATACDGDCDDGDAGVGPGANDVCDGVQDNDCDGLVDPQESDQDGEGLSPCDGDCDDADPAVHPWAIEVCNGLDDDCDGNTDDIDADGDGAIALACGGTDCDDDDPALLPGQPELCDGLDNDCDPATDEATDLDGDSFSLCDGDCDEADDQRSPGAADLCGGQDEDCSGVVDDDCVTCDGWVPGDFTDLQAAIDGAATGALICVQSGTWVGDLDTGGAALHLMGVAGAAMTIVQGSGAGSVVVMDSGEGRDTVFDRLTITGGLAAEAGGGLLLDDASPTLTRLIVAGNEAVDDGGGLAIWSGAPLLLDVAVSTNVAGDSGGGIYVSGWGASLEMTGGAVLGNEAPLGGGIGLRADATGALTDVLLEGNQATQGGGVYVDEGGLVVQAGAFVGNVALDDGGGARVYGSDLEMTNTELTGNQAHQGGGLYLLGHDSPAMLDGLVLQANQAMSGGGLYASQQDVQLSDSLVASNAATWGGGLSLTLNSTTLDQVEFVSNTAGALGGAVHFPYIDSDGADLVGSQVAFTGNSSAEGGAISSMHVGVEIDLTDATFSSNHASASGGGIRLFEQSTLLLESTTFDGCTAQAHGGAMALRLDNPANGNQITVELVDATFIGNQAQAGGGAIFARGDVDLVLDDVVAEGNVAGGWSFGGMLKAIVGVDVEATGLEATGNQAALGGAIYALNSPLLLDGAVLADNVALDEGGSIWSWGNVLDLDHVLFTGNEAGTDGGAVWTKNSLNVQNGIFTDNLAGADGGALYSEGGSPYVARSALVGNVAGGFGGAIRLVGGSDPNLWGVILASNSAGGAGGGLSLGASSSSALADLEVHHGDSWGNSPDDWHGFDDPSGTGGNLSVDPQLLDVSGADPTTWDLHLSATSPLVDMGPVNVDDPDGTRSDMGAFAGPGADDWDLDRDGAPAWWLPGPYQPGDPAAGLDCDDLDPTVGPASGC